MKLTDYIVNFLEELHIDTVFGYIGGSIADLVQSIYQSKSVRYIQSYNEQASAFAANAYAQVTGKTGVAISSSGPGAINLINGIANAYYDSIPCVFITGNVHSLGRKASIEIRQNAFQETDIVKLVETITKGNIYISDETKIRYYMQKAFYLANEGRKGPVLIDIPYDIQRKEIDVESLDNYCSCSQKKSCFSAEAAAAAELLLKSRKPLLLVGGGCQNARSILQRILKKISIPVVASMRGLDVISHEENSYIGFIGTYGNPWANQAILYCDLLIVLGSRLDERQIGYDKSQFAPNAKIIQVDIDYYELGRKTDNELSIHSDVGEFLKEFEGLILSYSCDDWIKLLNDWKNKCYGRLNIYNDIDANNIVKCISDIIDDDAVVVADVGQNQIMCAQSFKLRENNIFLCSAGLACMGYSLPAAIGAYYASPNRQIISINGDGGIMMNLQELQTVKREKIPVKVIVLNNNCLGLIRKLQEDLFSGNYYASIIGYSAPDFSKLAEAFEMDYFRVNKEEDIVKCKNLLQSREPVIIEVVLRNNLATISESGKNIYTQISGLSDGEMQQLE